MRCMITNSIREAGLDYTELSHRSYRSVSSCQKKNVKPQFHLVLKYSVLIIFCIYKKGQVKSIVRGALLMKATWLDHSTNGPVVTLELDVYDVPTQQYSGIGYQFIHLSTVICRDLQPDSCYARQSKMAVGLKTALLNNSSVWVGGPTRVGLCTSTSKESWRSFLTRVGWSFQASIRDSSIFL